MKKFVVKSLVLVSGLSLLTHPWQSYQVSAQDSNQNEESHDDHDHDFEKEIEDIVKKDGDHYIMKHGDHYHEVPVTDFTEEEQAEIDAHLQAHPELAEAYDKAKDIYAGYFADEDIKDRDLSDWEGEWQSVYPFLVDGTLDPVMEMKAMAEGATMNKDEYKEYYMVGYQTDVTHIEIDDQTMTFTKDGQKATGTYQYEGYEILTYKKGNRGVRYLFTKVDGDQAAPMSVQFSDHNIAPTDDLTHYHIYFADISHEELLEELDNWPTYYPADWDKTEILADQLNH